MKSRKKIVSLILIIVMVLFIVIFSVINLLIASSVISDMADVRIVKNDYTLEEYNLIGEQISVVSYDNLKINAYIVPNDDSKGNVLILHGMHGMDATSLFDYAKFVYDAGYTPVSIDMRAHGYSEGNSLSFGYNEIYDVNAVIDYLKNDDKFNNKPIILYGLSMGGSTAINVASISENVDGVIAISPFSAIQNQVADYMKKDGAPETFISVFKPYVNLVLWKKFNVNPIKESPEHTIKNMKDIPILIVHGDNDSQTNYNHSINLFNNSSSNNKNLWIVEGAEHLIVENVLDDSSSYYRDKIINYLNDNFSK